MERRRFLAGISALGTPLVAGCFTDEDTPTNTPTTTDDPTSPEPGTATPTDTPNGETPAGTESFEEPVDTDENGNTDTPTPTESNGPGGAADYVVEVDANGNAAFTPQTLEIEMGEKVKWVWKSDRHNIRPEAENNEWNGTPGEDDDIYYTGYEHSHTFTTSGEYRYYCDYHDGMTGTIVVTE